MPCKSLLTILLILLKLSVNAKYHLVEVEEDEIEDSRRTSVFNHKNNRNNYLGSSNNTNVNSSDYFDIGDFLGDGLKGIILGPRKGQDITTCPELGTEKIKFERMVNLEYNTQCWEDNQPVFSLSTRDGVQDLKIVEAKTHLTRVQNILLILIRTTYK